VSEQNENRHVAAPNQSVRAPVDGEADVQHDHEATTSTPFGPDQDPVFRSLPSGRSVTAPEVTTTIDAVCVLLARNIYTLAPRQNYSSYTGGVTENASSGDLMNEDMIHQLQEAEREAVQGVASDFVKYHVRRLTHDYSLKTPHELFSKGVVLVSQDNVHISKTRHAKFQWAIVDGQVVELRNVRIPVGHVGMYEREPNLNIKGRMSEDDVAVYLAMVLDVLDVAPAHPIAATGSIATNTNELLYAQDLDVLLDAAHEGHMHDVILPRHNQKVSGLHDQVRYWPSKDTNSAIFSVLSAMSGATISPNLVRRALTKQAYSWCSLIFALLAVLSYQLAVAVGPRPPVAFLEYVLGLTALFLIGSFVCTTRYWRLDR
jgi:hypothetical protein